MPYFKIGLQKGFFMLKTGFLKGFFITGMVGIRAIFVFCNRVII
jgi:hypothetical protein